MRAKVAVRLQIGAAQFRLLIYKWLIWLAVFNFFGKRFMGNRLVESSETPSVKDDGFISRLKQVIEKYGSVNSLAKAANLSESAIRKWRDGTSEPSRDRLVALAKAAQVSVEWLATGEGAVQRNLISQNNGSGFDRISSPLALINGCFTQSLEVAKEIVQILQEPQDYYVHIVDGRNMEPSLYPGDLCIFNKKTIEHNHPEEGVYAILLNEIVVVRRLQHMLDNQALISSDNVNYNSSNIIISLSNYPPHFSLLGKMAYYCRAS